MKHARKDYNRIQDPKGLIPADEPVFLLRGQDTFAPNILREYANRVERNMGDPEVVRLTRLQADAMDRWQDIERSKSPDIAP